MISMVQPTLETDAAPPERDSKGLVVLAGAIKWWWMSECLRCGDIAERAEGSQCAHCGIAHYAGDQKTYVEFWDSPEHREYVAWRNFVRSELITAGWLTYAPHEAFKGTWINSAQAVNDAAIAAANRMLVLSPVGTITDGTDEEVRYAHKVGTRVIYLPPGSQDSFQWQLAMR
jgi:hypothetical protein